MRLLWLAVVALSLGAPGFAMADQVPPREQPVTHLTLPACKAADLKLLAARRKFKDMPPQVQRIGPWQITRWPAIGDSPATADSLELSRSLNVDIDFAEFIEISRVGEDSKPACQFLVTSNFDPLGRGDVSFDAFTHANINWHREPIADGPVPQLIIGTYSGGASGCCWTNYIVSLGETPTVDRLAPVSGDDSLAFGEKNPVVPPDITLPDSTFFRWQGAAALDWGATAHYTLIWQSDRYVLEWPARAASPGNVELEKWQQEMTDALRMMSIDRRYRSLNDPNRGESNLTLNSVIWQHVLDLIYAGYTDMAVELLNKAWPKDIRGKDLFWRDFRKQLQDYSVIWDARHLGSLLPRHLPESP